MKDFKEMLIQNAKINSRFIYTSKPSGHELVIQFPDETHHDYSITGENYPNGVSFQTLDDLILELAGYESMLIHIRETEDRQNADDGIFDEHLMVLQGSY